MRTARGWLSKTGGVNPPHILVAEGERLDDLRIRCRHGKSARCRGATFGQQPEAGPDRNGTVEQDLPAQRRLESADDVCPRAVWQRGQEHLAEVRRPLQTPVARQPPMRVASRWAFCSSRPPTNTSCPARTRCVASASAMFPVPGTPIPIASLHTGLVPTTSGWARDQWIRVLLQSRCRGLIPRTGPLSRHGAPTAKLAERVLALHPARSGQHSSQERTADRRLSPSWSPPGEADQDALALGTMWGSTRRDRGSASPPTVLSPIVAARPVRGRPPSGRPLRREAGRGIHRPQSPGPLGLRLQDARRYVRHGIRVPSNVACASPVGAVQGELWTAKLSIVLRIIAGALLIVLRTRR